jgi:hypothetical protein
MFALYTARLSDAYRHANRLTAESAHIQVESKRDDSGEMTIILEIKD